MITITENLTARVQAEREKRQNPGVHLRITVDAGGCSGFQYQFTWENAPATPDDTVYDQAVIIDDISLPFLQDATIDFVKTLMGEDFKITNPNAVSGCGCGQSFSV